MGQTGRFITIPTGTVQYVEKKHTEVLYISTRKRCKSRLHRLNLMKLIREEIETVDFIVEERNGKKNMFIEGIFLQGNLKNRNVVCIQWKL